MATQRSMIEASRHALGSMLPAALALGLMALAGASQAQDDRPEITVLTPQMGESAKSYDRATRWTWTQRRLIYVDTLKGEIPMDGAPAYRPPEPQQPRSSSGEAPDARGVLMLLGVLALLGWLAWRFGGPAAQMFAGRPRDGAAPERTASPTGDATAPLTGLEALEAMADREAALVLLVQEALARAATANGIATRRSETARETLRRLPGNWPLIQELRQIVMAEELVQFGGRPLTQEVFSGCIQAAGPIWKVAA